VETGGLDVDAVQTGDLEVGGDLNTHYLLAGISFRF
jgi:hypothetical protein